MNQPQKHPSFSFHIESGEAQGNVVPAAGSTLGYVSPSFGIIASGDVAFQSNVTRVDAYVFTNGNINTCPPNKSPECANKLTVNGFLMSKSLTLNRFGFLAGLSQATVGEYVQLTPQLYLNPPPLFEASGGANSLKSLGERPPLN